ncbi:MAG TPA: CPBP family intramembrane glutamic endopeptidase [Rubrobacteraceae bacterium]|nr:CPBP family intramembrane glutamic endopeptidase [Rubrobacteraceae bacterium]
MTEVLMLALTLVAGLALLSHWGKKNRRADVSLILMLLFISFLILGLGALLSAGMLLSEVVEMRELGEPGAAPAIAAFIFTGAGIAGLALCAPPLLKVLGRPPKRPFWSDPPVFFALWLFTMVLSYNLANLILFEDIADALTLSEESRISPGLVLASQLPLVVIALVGVGVGVRRGPRETLVRLGYGPVSPLQLGVVFLFILGAFGLSSVADHLFATLQPELYERVGEISDALFNPEGLDPLTAVLFALLLGFGAAAGEETLFRGAVQPVFGITLTSVLFASMHIQYGPSILLVYIFVLSLGLGLLRKRINTTASFLAHSGYNASSVLLAYFFGV